VCNCFTMKVFVSNFKVEKRENLDNAFYVFYVFFDMTLQKHVKSRVFLNFQKKVKNVFSNYAVKFKCWPVMTWWPTLWCRCCCCHAATSTPVLRPDPRGVSFTRSSTPTKYTSETLVSCHSPFTPPVSPATLHTQFSTLLQ